MDWSSVINRVDVENARAFVHAARVVIDAMLLEAESVRAAQTPAQRDYNAAELPRTTPAGGWLSHDELRQTAQQIGEAIAAERWLDGMLFTLRLFGKLGGL